MTLEVPQRIRQRLAAVIDDLKSAIGQEGAKAYLTSIFTVDSLVLEPEVELCDDSWMEYINEDCMTDASDLSYPMPCSPYEKIEEPFLKMTMLPSIVAPSRQPYISRKRHTRGALRVVSGTKETSPKRDIAI